MEDVKIGRKISINKINEKNVIITSGRKVMRKTKCKNVRIEKISMDKKTIPQIKLEVEYISNNND